MSAAADDTLTIGQPLGTVGRQCGIDIVVARQVIGQRPSIARRFGRAHADMRPRHEGRIADQRDAADNHGRGLQVDDRLQQRLARLRHHLGERWPTSRLVASALIRASTSGCSRSGGTAMEY